MGKIVAFEAAQSRKEHERKEAKAKKLQSSFRSSREAAVSKPVSAEKLKRLFKGRSDKKK